MSIATKTGDKGETSLMYGRRLSKADARIEANGCIDELTSALGMARAICQDDKVDDYILAVQKDLIVVMGELATASEDLERYEKDGFQRVTAAMTDRLTAEVEALESSPSMKFNDWVIPGGTTGSAALDVSRGVCRRAERAVEALVQRGDAINPEILRYLNRLSDLCWLLARYLDNLSRPHGQSRR